MNQPLSVTVVAASPETTGSTVLNRMLSTLKHQRVTAIIPARGSQKPRTENGVSMLPTTERFKRLGRGCSCCTVRSDLMTKIKRLSEAQSTDHIVIKLAPRSDLDVLLKTFRVSDTNGFRLEDIARLESVITVVDASSLLSTLASKESDALIDRIRYASMVALENTEAMTSDMYEEIVRRVKAINASVEMIGDAQIVPAQHSPAPLQCNLTG